MELQIDAIYHFLGICKPVAAWEDEIREKSNQIPSLSLLSVTRERRPASARLPSPLASTLPPASQSGSPVGLWGLPLSGRGHHPWVF